MAKLLIETQVYENYGANWWDGEGECPQQWKAKGGEDYVILGVNPTADLTMLVNSVKPQVESNNHAYREHIISWEIIGDSDLTPWEALQFEARGRITYYAKILTLPTVECAAYDFKKTV